MSLTSHTCSSVWLGDASCEWVGDGQGDGCWLGPGDLVHDDAAVVRGSAGDGGAEPGAWSRRILYLICHCSH